MIDFHTWLESKKHKDKDDKKKKGSLELTRDEEGETEVVGDKKSPKIGKKNRLSLNASGEPIETA